MKSLVSVDRRMKLYIDIIINLTYKIYNTHPGFDCLIDEIDIRNHFNWCLRNTIKDFLYIDIDISKFEISDMLYEFYSKEIYKTKKLRDVNVYLNIWKILFSGQNSKMITYIYNLYGKFDKIVDYKFGLFDK